MGIVVGDVNILPVPGSFPGIQKPGVPAAKFPEQLNLVDISKLA